MLKEDKEGISEQESSSEVGRNMGDRSEESQGHKEQWE